MCSTSPNLPSSFIIRIIVVMTFIIWVYFSSIKQSCHLIKDLRRAETCNNEELSHSAVIFCAFISIKRCWALTHVSVRRS